MKKVPLECVILIGLPASGKTTFFMRYFGATHRHVSQDLWPVDVAPAENGGFVVKDWSA
jgi:hypothetical protein